MCFADDFPCAGGQFFVVRHGQNVGQAFGELYLMLIYEKILW